MRQPRRSFWPQIPLQVLATLFRSASCSDFVASRIVLLIAQVVGQLRLPSSFQQRPRQLLQQAVFFRLCPRGRWPCSASNLSINFGSIAIRPLILRDPSVYTIRLSDLSIPDACSPPAVEQHSLLPNNNVPGHSPTRALKYLLAIVNGTVQNQPCPSLHCVWCSRRKSAKR